MTRYFDQVGGQPEGSLVLDASGLMRPIERLSEGDVIMSPQQNGTVAKVRIAEVLRVGASPTVKVFTTGRGGEKSFLCAANHSLAFRALNRPGSSSGPRQRTSECMTMSVSEFCARGDNWKSKARAFTTPGYDLPTQDFPVEPWTLGVLLGDGCLTDLDYYGGYDHQLGYNFGSGASITSAQSVLNKLASLHGLGSPRKLPGRKCYSLYIRDGGLKDGLRALKLVRKDSYSKFIPECYFVGSLDQRLQLLAGLIDTDGTWEEFSSSNQGLAKGFARLIYSVGGVAKVTERETQYRGQPYQSYRVTYSTAEYEIPNVVNYKKRKIRDMSWKNPRNTSFSIVPARAAPLYCLVLEGGSGWYVTDDFLVIGSAKPVATC